MFAGSWSFFKWLRIKRLVVACHPPKLHLEVFLSSRWLRLHRKGWESTLWRGGPRNRLEGAKWLLLGCKFSTEKGSFWGWGWGYKWYFLARKRTFLVYENIFLGGKSTSWEESLLSAESKAKTYIQRKNKTYSKSLLWTCCCTTEILARLKDSPWYHRPFLIDSRAENKMMNRFRRQMDDWCCLCALLTKLLLPDVHKEE